MSTPSRAPVLSASGLSKTFGGRTVLRDFALEIEPGEIHGLVGQNGSGKSTLIKILAGYHVPDPGGSLAMNGEPVPLPLTPPESRRAGMSFVHQDLGLIASATVLENIRIGQYETRAGWWISWRRERQRVQGMLDRFGINVLPSDVIAELPQVDRAMVAIARALEQVRSRALESLEDEEAGRTPLLILDEPTPHLPRDGVQRLFGTVRQMAASGAAVLFVTHRLEEIRELTHRVSVLRNGVLVDTADTSRLSEQDLIDRILGFSLERLYPTPHEVQSDVALKIEGLAGKTVEECTLEARHGEIIGLTGLLGMGWESIPYLLFGAMPAMSGSITLEGRRHDLSQWAPQRAVEAGFALIPADRHADGALIDATVAENLTLATLSRYYVTGMLRRRRELREVHRQLEEFDVRPPDPHRRLGTLSGGNQQKVVVAKWFETNPRLLLLHEPTQGVDIGARAQIFQRIRDAAQQGMIVLYASAEWEDLAHLADRVLIFRNGRVVSQLRGAELTPERIAEQSFSELAAPGQRV